MMILNRCQNLGNRCYDSRFLMIADKISKIIIHWNLSQPKYLLIYTSPSVLPLAYEHMLQKHTHVALKPLPTHLPKRCLHKPGSRHRCGRDRFVPPNTTSSTAQKQAQVPFNRNKCAHTCTYLSCHHSLLVVLSKSAYEFQQLFTAFLGRSDPWCLRRQQRSIKQNDSKGGWIPQ